MTQTSCRNFRKAISTTVFVFVSERSIEDDLISVSMDISLSILSDAYQGLIT